MLAIGGSKNGVQLAPHCTPLVHIHFDAVMKLYRIVVELMSHVVK